ncbi:MAG TPA: arsenate reductase ArsC [Opitutaceae bacterium]|nr:arsenate reductase ArsC [Opitutaceae bacterium]HRJ46681.1 arsenate reductase ArsC [Opitutaceae bacterium]
MPKLTVLILCTGNSCRSQMAEGLLRAAAGDLIEVHSAGVKPAAQVQPGAIAVLAEIGIDISAQRPKHLDCFLHRPMHTVITVCDHVAEVCPVFPGKVRRHHWGFRDPAQAVGSEVAVMGEFRAVRDEMKRIFDAYAGGLRDGINPIAR